MPRKLLVSFLSLIFLAALGWRLIRGQPWLSFTQIDCQLENQACPQQLLDQVTTLEQASFFFCPLEKVISSWDLSLYQLENYQKTWPGQLRLNFVSEPGYYQLELDHQRLTVTENGHITATGQNQNLPRFILNSEQEQTVLSAVENQASIPSQLHQTWQQIVTQLNELELKTLSMSYQPDLLKLELEPDLVALADPHNLAVELAKLAIILEEQDMDQIDVAIKEIDLRYELPVLRTQLST